MVSETTYCATLSMVLGFLLMGSRNRQVMSPSAHLPMRLLFSSFNTDRSILSIFLLLLLLNLIHGNLPVTVSLLPMALTRTFCLSQAMLTGSREFQSERSGPENDTDLCQCLSLPYCHTGTCTFTLFLAQFIFQTVSLNFSCIACISCILHHLFSTNSRFPSWLPPGSKEEEEQQQGSLKLRHFARPCAQTVPSARGSSSIGFTPCPRPRVRGPAPTLLTKGRFPPGSVCGVGRKRAIALSSLCQTLFCLLFLLVFAQAPAAQHTHARTEPMRTACPNEQWQFWIFELPLPHSPRKRGQIQNSLLLRPSRAA